MKQTTSLWLWLSVFTIVLWTQAHSVRLPTTMPPFLQNQEEGVTENPVGDFEEVNPTDTTENEDREELYDKLLESQSGLEELESGSGGGENEALEPIYEEAESREATTVFPTLLSPVTNAFSFSSLLINKTGRNFGSKIRGIGTNSANSVIDAKNSSFSGSNIQKSNSPLLRARPASSVISYNPTNYNRLLKRRKNPYLGKNATNVNAVVFDDTTSRSNFTNDEQPTVIPSHENSRGTTKSSTGSNSNTTNPNVMISSRPLSSFGLRAKRPKPVVLSDTPATTPSTYSDGMKQEESSIAPSPTHPFKVRRIKITSRRPALGLMNQFDFASSPVQPSESIPTSSVPIPSAISDTMSIKKLDVPAASDNNHALEESPASVSVTVSNGVYRYRFPEVQVSSRRVFSEEFGIQKDSYGQDDDDVETTTEYYYANTESPTESPLEIFIEGSMNEDDITPTRLPPKYRDYFPEDADSNLSSASKDNGSDIDNDQHRRSNEKEEKKEDSSSVTVTVTHTVIETSANGDKVKSQDVQIKPTEIQAQFHPIASEALIHHYNVSGNSNENSQSNEANHQVEIVDDIISSTSTATPALPSAVIPLLTSSSVKVAQGGLPQLSSVEAGPSQPVNHPFEFSKSKDLVSIMTESFGNSSGQIISTHYGIDGDVHHEGEDAQSHEHQPEHDHDTEIHSNENSSDKGNGEPEEKISLTPANINPTPLSPIISSKDFKSVFYTSVEHPHFTSSSYEFTTSSTYSYFIPEDNHNEAEDTHHEPPYDDHTQKQQELRPTTTSFWDNLGYKSMVLVLSNKTGTTGPPGTTGFNTNVKPSGSTPFLTDQEPGFSTPEIDTEFPPLSQQPSEGTTPRPGNDAENEISEEELNKAATKEKGQATNTRPISSEKPNSGKDASKDKTVHKNHQEGFQPSVPIFVQMMLDLPRAVFCSNLLSFKEMIVTVYADQQMTISPKQIIVLTEPNCSDTNSASNSTTSTKIVNASTINLNSDSVINGKDMIVNNQTSSQVPSKAERKTRSAEQKSGSEYNQTSNSSDVANSIGNTNKSAFLPVYFYINNNDGNYDRGLTESFLGLWTKNTTSGNMFYPLVKGVDMISSSHLVSEHAPSNENSGIIAAITIASIAAACLFLLGVLLLVMRHRQAQNKFAKRCTPVTLDDYSLDNISVYNSFRRKQRMRGSKRSYTNAAFDDPNAPSRQVTSANIVATLSDASGLESEFKAIPNINPTLDDIPAGAETKNRYANVIPMPDSRVLLTFQDEQANSDYINANFIRGVNGEPKKYIITQGPLDDTIVDFWRMVWEQQIRVILMVTDFAESGILKCAEYYPRSETIDCSQLHGDFQITLERRDITENCITSYLVIKDMERSLRRDVIHIWYHSWPEKGVPTTPNATADFLIKARKFTKEPSPVLVHCSPGTGRSGTIVACDIAMKTFETLHSVDIPRCVMKIRQDRSGSVQTKEQYLHIYEVLQYYASRISGHQPDSI